MNESMIIGISGYGYTGASAYRDLLREFEFTQSLPFEFQIIQQPDGLYDLYHDIVISRRRVKINASIKRFIRNIDSERSNLLENFTKKKYRLYSREYINEIIQNEWIGNSAYDPIDCTKKYGRVAKLVNKAINKVGKNLNASFIWPKPSQRYYSAMDDSDFIKITKDYILRILAACGFDIERPIILEQVFNVSNPTIGMDFFNNPKCLVVDRDPRDIFILTNFLFKTRSQFMPNNGDVDDFINFYQGLHTNYEGDERVKYVKYEDLIYGYASIVESLTKWLGLEHKYPKKYFVPECSINNTRLFERYPQFSKSINEIEKRLEPYLYDFDCKSQNLEFKAINIAPFDRQEDVKI